LLQSNGTDSMMTHSPDRFREECAHLFIIIYDQYFSHGAFFLTRTGVSAFRKSSEN